jgi:hypothetical protein
MVILDLVRWVRLADLASCRVFVIVVGEADLQPNKALESSSESVQLLSQHCCFGLLLPKRDGESLDARQQVA